MLSTDNSNAEHGCVNSNLVIASGLMTPMIPFTTPFTNISAHLPKRKRESKYNKLN